MIAVCGTGSWGTALAAVLANNNPEKQYIWGRDKKLLADIINNSCNKKYLPGIKLPKNIISCDRLSDLLEKATDILIAVPSHAFRGMLQQIKPFFTSKHRIIWATKGLEPKTSFFLHQVIADEFGQDCICAVLSGPSFAKEVALGSPTAVTVASKNTNFNKDLVDYFHNDSFRVYTSTDLIGVQLGGVFKNILAVATGIADGLGFGPNARAALITRGLAEIMRLGPKLGANNETLMGLSGIGDVILTCTDDQSRNRRFGLALAKGANIEEAEAQIKQVVEAVHNTAEIYQLSLQHNIEMPIIAEVQAILTGKITATQAVNNLISRKPRPEARI